MSFPLGISKAMIRRAVLTVVGCSALGALFFLYLHYSQAGTIATSTYRLEKLFQTIIGTNVLGLLALAIDNLLNRLLQWKTRFLLRFITGFIINASLAVGLILFIGILYFKVNQEEVWKLSILFIVSIFVYEIFYGLFYSYRFYSVTQVEQLRSERWQMELQFESLKSQISPHYLFNCLNTISSLLYKDSRMAEEFIRRMADTFRYVMSNQNQKLVSLKEEIEFIKSYYYLLQVRFEHHLKLEVNIPKNLMETRVPPMTLQMLVENAVKHNLISKEQPLLVYISAQDNTFITVSNTRTQAIHPGTSFHVGLDNIRNRYRFFTTEKVVVKEDERFTVQLPVLKFKASSSKQAASTEMVP